jgi:hypothetical protein
VAIKRQTGEIVEGPDFVVRGLASPEEEADAFEQARRVVRARIEELGPRPQRIWPSCKKKSAGHPAVFSAVEFGRRPVVVPYVMEL